MQVDKKRLYHYTYSVLYSVYIVTESTILTREQVEQLEPMLVTLSLVPKDLAQKTQTIAFKQENKQLSLLTTNNFPQLFHQVLDKLQAQGYTCTTYFTDSDSFGHAMTWFQRLEKQQAQQAEKDAYKAQAT